MHCRVEFLVSLVFLMAWLNANSRADDLPEKMQRIEDFVTQQCIDCHSGSEPEAGFDLESLEFDPGQFTESKLDTSVWEKILRRIDAREMPPPSVEQPAEKEYEAISNSLSKILQKRSKDHPQVGRIGSIRRLTRTEYQNAIRDLLGIQIQAADYLPKDESSHGFDNITVEELSPTSLNRYLSAAQKIARVAIGGAGGGPVGLTVRIPADRSQEDHVEGLPFGTRGGTVFEHHFPRDGLYEIELKLTRDRDEKVEGLHRKHDIDVLIDRKRVHRFQVKPPENKDGWENRDFTHSDSHLNTRIKVAAGSHSIGVTFPRTFSSLVDEKRQPFDAAFNRHRHPRRTPAIYQISIVGPFEAGDAGWTKTRQLIYGDLDPQSDHSREDAMKVIGRLAARAFRRPVTQTDLETPMKFFDIGMEEGGYEQGIESALSSLLVNPNFLFRIEEDRESSLNVTPISDIELASRLSFFLWSSIPDEELLELASLNQLSDPANLREQVERMLGEVV